MKKALYYAIKRNLHNDIVAVTSEKSKGRWYGRYVKDTTATHGAPGYGMSDIMGRFDTSEEAEAKRTQIAAIAKEYEDRRSPHQKAISELHHMERRAIDRAVNGDRS